MSSFFIQQFGCRATQADGAAIERQLLQRGCTPAANPNSANVVVINTCTVTASADSQARDAIRKIHAQNPAAQVIVTGCYAQRAPEELAALPGVSWVVGNSHKPQIPDLITQIAPLSPKPSPNRDTVIPSEARNLLFLSGLAPTETARHATTPAERNHANSRPAQVLTGDINQLTDVLVAPVQGGESHHTRPTLKIQDGCNNRCSFCVIPFVRGKSRSLLPDQVIREILNLTVEQALLPVSSPSSPNPRLTPTFHAREIVLSGINLGTYGRDLSTRVEFEDLLRRILDETPLERLRISSIEPQDVTQDLIELFASTDRIAQHFHMPLQSASDRILAAMHRWYRAEHYARRVQLIHERLPHAAIGADVITGFPGETDSDHAATLAFIESLPFTYLHVFSYSPRPGTKAASLPDQVPPATIKRRARQLRALSEAKSAAFRQSQLGRTLRVLTLNREENSIAELPGIEYTPALSSNYLRVHVPGIFPSNHWLDVEITIDEGDYLLSPA